jgi:hypothetical protein
MFVHQSSKLVFRYRYESFVRFEVSTVVKIRIVVVWFVALCSFVGGLKCLGGRYHIHLQNGSQKQHVPSICWYHRELLPAVESCIYHNKIKDFFF